MSFRIFSHFAATALLQRLLFLLTTMTTGVAGRCSPAAPPPPQVAHHKLSRPGLSPTRRFPKLLQPASQCQCKNCNKFQRVPQGSTSTNKDPSDVNTNANNLFSEAPCAYGVYDVNIASNVDCYLKINHEATNKNDLVYSLIEMEAVE